MTKHNAISQREDALLALLREHPTGLAQAACATGLSISRTQAKRALASLRWSGQIVLVRDGECRLWVAPEHAAAAQAMCDANKRDRNRVNDKRREARRAERKRLGIEKPRQSRAGVKAQPKVKPIAAAPSPRKGPARYRWPGASYYAEPQRVIASVWDLAAA